MVFLLLCAALAWMLQFAALLGTESRHRTLRWLPLLLMESLPLGGALYHAVRTPTSGLGWEFRAATCLWIAGAVLLGCVLAWVIYVLRKR